ncbi:MAG: response regulator transcription factor [Oscillospiraceae bacterium]
MKIIIVDDDRLVTSALKTILTAGGIDCIATGADADDAVRLFETHAPDIVLMDIRMGAKTGLDAAREILSRAPAARILFLTTFDDDDYILTALKIGAKGYILKQNYESIVPSLHAVMQGQTVFGAEIVTKLPALLSGSAHKAPPAQFDLAEKETEIIALVARGLSNKEISATLYLSEGTVRNYISIILEKLNLRDRTQLAIFYYNSLQLDGD